MKKNRVNKVCIVCRKTFEVTKCRESLAKFCSRECYIKHSSTRVPWNKGKSYEELYDKETSSRIKTIQSNYSQGENNPMYGKHHSNKSKKVMSKKKEGYRPWITGKKIPGLFKNRNHFGENNAYIKYVLKEDGITYQQYLDRLTEKEKYYREILRLTKMQPIHFLENYDKRGKRGYHLDHIYPIHRGFLNKMPPEIISDISNLRFIPWEDNLKKSDKLLEEMEKELYDESVICNRD